jgi:CTP:molybdopterin cytidylyltransferase MocA
VAFREVVTLVLAAGKGERAGGPKALLAWPIEGASPARKVAPQSPSTAGFHPLAIAHAEARLAAESKRVIIVTRKTMVGPLLGYVRPGIDVVSSTAADELGAAGSLRFGLERAGAFDAAIVTPVDTPPARGDTVATLLGALGDGDPPPLAVRPRFNRRAGHPVALRPEALEPYRGTAPPPPLRDHLKTLGARAVDIDLEDRMVLADLDTPADVVALLGSRPRFLGWK